MLLRNRFVNTAAFLRAPDDGGAGGALAGAAASTPAVVDPAGGAPAAGGAAATPAGGSAAAAAAAGTPAAGSETPAGGAAGAAAAASGTPAAGTPAAGAADPAADAATIAAGGAPKPAAGATPAAATFPETWRQDLAGADASALKVLERYASPKAFFDAHLGLVKKISAGELKNVAPAPPEKATPEQLADWRKENGLPVETKGYVDAIKLPDGVVPGDADKPLLEGFAASALEANMPPAAYNAAVNWYFKNLDAQNKQRSEADHNQAGEAVRVLEAEWGPEFKANQNRIGALFADSPEVADMIFTARDAKGRILGNTPEFCRAIAQAHKAAYPAYSATTPDNAASSQSVATEMTKIEGLMGDPRSTYNEKNSSGQLTDGAKAMRSRYRDLVDAQQKNTRAA